MQYTVGLFLAITIISSEKKELREVLKPLESGGLGGEDLEIFPH